MLRPEGDTYKNNRNQKIYKACYNACISLFNAKPIYIDENKKKMTAKFTDEKFGGLHEGIEDFREFLVEGKANIFGAIVLADCSDESDQIIKFYVNFYKLINRYKAKMFHIVKFYTGEESEKIVHGKNLEGISNFETTLNSKAPAGENTSEILFSLNKKKMVLFLVLYSLLHVVHSFLGSKLNLRSPSVMKIFLSPAVFHFY